MRLWEWVNARKWGTLRELERATGIRYATLHGYYSETRYPQYERAETISKATGGDVSIAELCKPRKGARPPKRTSKRAAVIAARARAKARSKRRAAMSEASA